jgi:uncharacterized protein YjiS (DUF1127 family)
MTTAEYFGQTRPRNQRTFGNAGAFVLSAIRTWRRWSRMRRAIVELNGLDDRMLSDIGLSRSTLYVSAREAYGFKDRGHGGF